jgi:hypothetical protein
VVPTAKRLNEMTRPDKRKAVLRSLWRATASVALLLLGYGLLPLAARTTTDLVIRIIIAGIVVIGFVLYEVRMISRSEFPQLRAADALMIGITLIVVLFSSIYLSMSKTNGASFSESLDRTGAMYLTMTTLSTVGFGDVVAKTDGARITVMIQMVFNVAFIGLAVKWISFTARRRFDNTAQSGIGGLE